jgi:hypothetical protein
MMSTRFLPMSWTSPFTVAITIVPLPELSDRSMCGSRWATAVFITSAEASTNGNCICPDPNSSPTVFIPDSSVSLMISSAGRCRSASSRSASSPPRSPSTMRRSRRSNRGSRASSSARPALAEDAVTPSNSSMNRARGS